MGVNHERVRIAPQLGTEYLARQHPTRLQQEGAASFTYSWKELMTLIASKCNGLSKGE